MVKQDDREVYLDGYLKNSMDIMIKKVKKKWDCVLIATGKEGDGKSVLMATMMKYLDPTFNMDRCFLNGKEFLEALIRADPIKDKFKAFMLDEGQEFTSRAAMTKFNRLMVHVLSKIRSKQLFIGICIPNFWELDSYGAVHRSTALLRVYSNRLQRGYFEYYNWEKKKILYYQGKKQGQSWIVTKPNFRGKFVYKSFPFDQDKYDEKKHRSMEEIDLSELDRDKKHTGQRDGLIMYLSEVVGLTQREIAEILANCKYPLSQQQVSKIINTYHKKYSNS